MPLSPKINMQQIHDALEMIHQRLLRLEGPCLGGDDDGEWQVVPKRGRKEPREFEPKGRKGGFRPTDKGKLPPHKVAEAVREFNDYWKRLTKKDINFQFRGQDMNFLSVSEPSLYRDGFIRRYFRNRPVIVDVFGGVGGDAITFLYMLNPARIDVIEMLHSDEDRERIRLLNENLESFKRAFSEYSLDQIEHRVFDSSFERYMEAYPPTRIDLLYLDPPWVLQGTNEATPVQLFEYLNEMVFSKLVSNGLNPRVICIKTRFDWEKCQVIMKQIPDYLHLNTTKNLPFNGKYHFHIMVQNKAEQSDWHHTKIFDDAYHQKHIEDSGENPEGGLPLIPFVY